MKRFKEYDLAYICYYSERIALSSIAAGFEKPVAAQTLNHIVQELKQKELFHFYKTTYEELLEESP